MDIFRELGKEKLLLFSLRDLDSSEIPLPLKKVEKHDSIIPEDESVFEFDSRLEPRHPHSIQCLTVVREMVWAGCRNGVVRKWLTESGEFLEDFKAHKTGVYTLQVVSGFVWAASEDGNINAFAIDSEKREKRMKIHKIHRSKGDEVGIRCLTPLRVLSDLDARSKYVRVVTADTRGVITLWKVKKKSPSNNIHSRIVANFDSVVHCVRQDNVNSDHLWFGLVNNVVVFDWKTGTTLAKWVAHSGPVNGFASYGNFVWTAGHDSSVCVWDAKKIFNYEASNEPEDRITAHSSRILAIERIGNHIVTGSFDMSIIFYDAETREVVQESKQHKDGVRCLLAISDNVLWSGSMSRDGTVGVWTRKT